MNRDDTAGGVRFALAPMSPLLVGMTVPLLALPVVFVLAALYWARPLLIVAGFLVVIYAWVWLRFRPTRFVIGREGIWIHWPLKRRLIPLADIAAVRSIGGAALRAEIGWGMRVGAGGLWGGFGRLWTQKRGALHMFISRLDGYVWIDCREDEPWLITPERPEEFVRALEAMLAGPPGGR